MREKNWEVRQDLQMELRRANVDQVFDEHFTNALHMMQDHVQQTTVISQRRSQKTFPEQAARIGSTKRADSR